MIQARAVHGIGWWWWEGGPSNTAEVPTFQLRDHHHPSPITPRALKNFSFLTLGLFSFPISSSVVHLKADRMDPAFRVEFKYICIILHDYCVIVGVVVVPQEASSSSHSIGAFGRFRPLRVLSRGALGSSRPLPWRPPPPASSSSSPLLLGSSSSPPPLPSRGVEPGRAGRAERRPRAGSRAQEPAGGGAGRAAGSGEAPGPALLRSGAGRGPRRARGGESRLAPPLCCPPQSCRLPRGRTVL